MKASFQIEGGNREKWRDGGSGAWVGKMQVLGNEYWIGLTAGHVADVLMGNNKVLISQPHLSNEVITVDRGFVGWGRSRDIDLAVLAVRAETVLDTEWQGFGEEKLGFSWNPNDEQLCAISFPELGGAEKLPVYPEVITLDIDKVVVTIDGMWQTPVANYPGASGALVFDGPIAVGMVVRKGINKPMTRFLPLGSLGGNEFYELVDQAVADINR